MSTYINTSNCGCLGGQVHTPNPPIGPCPDTSCDDCMVVSSPVIQPKDAVGPCGKSATIALADLNNYTACSGAAVHQILSFDENAFASVSVTSNGELTYVTSNEAEAGKYYDISYKVVCTGESIGGFGIIRVGIKDICQTLLCAPNEDCNRCTEECDPKESNLSVSVSSNLQTSSGDNANLSVSTSSDGDGGSNLTISIDSNT